MAKKRKHKSTRGRHRTISEIKEEQSRTLYVRLAKTIKSVDEINELFVGDFTVKLPRQSTRYCHVIFPSVEEKLKNLKLVKEKVVNGKPVHASTPRPINLEKPKKPKKIKIPDPKEKPRVPLYLLISKIPPGTKASEIKAAFSGSVTVVLLKGLVGNTRQAKVKMSSPDLCTYYVKRKSEWPVFKGKKVKVSYDEPKRRSRRASKSLKIYNGESEKKDDKKSVNKDDKKLKNKENGKSDNCDKEQSSNDEEIDSADESEEDNEVSEDDDENQEQGDEESEEEEEESSD
ncbi:nucleolin [Copidosoma floridanum]|uniref:nucleolin n=1 Tax=Copidosoma floridanum TaxID=29053 RepID=UPI0006C9E014|nr:nucleolin [Copidosoma floridanum]